MRDYDLKTETDGTITIVCSLTKHVLGNCEDKASAQEFIKEQAEIDELAGTYSDFHKDLQGYRPREPLPPRVEQKRYFQMKIAELNTILERRSSTEEGRALLREEGWNV